MFDIEYKGGNGLVLSSKNTTLVVDPKLSLIGLKDIKVKDCVQLGTEQRFCIEPSDAKITIEGPGEYEVGDITIRGIAAARHIDTPDQERLATMYRLESGEISVALLGNIAPKLGDDQLEALGVVDVLIVPVGGSGYTLDATSATSVVRSIEPKVIIPVHFAESGIRYEVPQDSLETFTKELGLPVEQVAKLKLKSATALPATSTVYHIARS